MTYQAIALSNKYEGGRKSGTITLTGNQMVFISDSEEVRVNSSEVILTSGGANDRLLYINHPSWDGLSIYTTDKTILKDVGLSRNPTLSQVIKAKKSNRNKLVYSLLGIVFVCALVLYAFIQSRSSIVEGLANKIPVEYEQKIGDKLFSVSVDQHMLVKDSILDSMLSQAINPIVAQVKDTTYHFNFHIINDPTLNAFALPGGTIVLNSGMLSKAESWEEIQGVVAHEISHVTKRHHARGVLNQLGVFFFVSVVVGDVSALAETVTHYGAQMESLMYTREFETEADESGWDYLVQADINPEGMIAFFEKIKEVEAEHEEIIDDDLMSFMSTHPATEDRIESMKKKKEKLNREDFSSLDIDLDSFKNRLQQLTNK